MPIRFFARLARVIVCTFASAPMCAGIALAGANFVTYDHHTEEAGTTEIQLFNDYSRTSGEHERCTAQLLEVERALTDRWMVAAYLEAHAVSGQDWSFDGGRFETRYRLSDNSAPVNPVLYFEYVNVKEGSHFLREVTGRVERETPGEAENENAREQEIETKLILGRDVSNRLSVSVNWINDADLKSGNWEFGYAAGLIYKLFDDENPLPGSGAMFKEVAVGLELYGGLGDSARGLTANGDVTQHYAGINLKTEFANGAFATIGGAFGITDASQDAILRTAAGWEFD